MASSPNVVTASQSWFSRRNEAWRAVRSQCSDTDGWHSEIFTLSGIISQIKWMILVIFLLSYSFIRFSRLEGKRPRNRNPKCWFGQISEQSKGPLSAALLLAADRSRWRQAVYKLKGCSISVLTALTILSHTPNKLGIPYVNCRSLLW